MTTTDTLPVIVFDANARKYIQLGEHPESGDAVTVLEQFGKQVAEVFGDEYHPIFPHAWEADGRAVRYGDLDYAVDTASWHFKEGELLNMPKTVSVEKKPKKCFEHPKEFFPNADSHCWCIPGFYGNNEREGEHLHDAMKDAMDRAVEARFGDDPDIDMGFEKFSALNDYLDAKAKAGVDTSVANQAKLATDKASIEAFVAEIDTSNRPQFGGVISHCVADESPEDEEENAERVALNTAREFVLDFVVDELYEELKDRKSCVCLDITDLAHEALTALEEKHPELKEMHLFHQVERWAESEAHGMMHARGYKFSYPSTLLSFTLLENASA